VEIVTLDAPDAPWLATSPVKAHALGPARGSYGYASNFANWVRTHRDQFDALLVHGIWQYSSFGVWRGTRDSATPYFVFPHGMLDPWFRKKYPLKHLKKMLYWRWGEYRVLRDAKAVLFTSDEEKRLAQESFVPYRCEERVVSYGTAAPDVDLSAAREHFLERFPHLRGKRILLFLGRLHEKKGCEMLIAAFAANFCSAENAEAFHLVLAGPASENYLGKLKRMAEDLCPTGAPHSAPITFPGMLSGEMKWGAFSAADAFILPSHQENFGIAVAEALACGTPVLVSNKVNIWREIVQSGAGYADEDNVAGTTRLIERWSQGSPEDRVRLSVNAQKCFQNRFEIEQATDSLLEVLSEARNAG
jgi:glycosyltransferase involved in cell wall biosynthesis